MCVHRRGRFCAGEKRAGSSTSSTAAGSMQHSGYSGDTDRPSLLGDCANDLIEDGKSCIEKWQDQQYTQQRNPRYRGVGQFLDGVGHCSNVQWS